MCQICADCWNKNKSKICLGTKELPVYEGNKPVYPKPCCRYISSSVNFFMMLRVSALLSTSSAITLFQIFTPSCLIYCNCFLTGLFCYNSPPPTNSSKISLYMYSPSIQYLFVAPPNFNFLIMVHFLKLAALMFLIITGTTLIAS